MAFHQGWGFSVRTAYHALGGEQSNTLGQAGNHVGWKDIWGAKAWPKVKGFMWKLRSNALPLRTNLARRGVPTSPLCLFYAEEEDGKHMAMGCTWTHPVWARVLNLDVALAGMQGRCRTGSSRANASRRLSCKLRLQGGRSAC